MTDIHQVWIDGKPQLGRHALAARAYNRKFPDRPPLSYGGKNPMVTGAWMIGSCYKNPARMPDGSPFYGGYPYGYLERVHAMFPDARKILHVFSGGLTRPAAILAAWQDYDPIDSTTPPREMELVDMYGPEQGRYPTWKGDILDYTIMPEVQGRFDLILADPPYSAEDAAKYDCPPVNRAKVIHALRRVAAPGANLVWLDVVWPMHRKIEWKLWGAIGLIRSTNHRVRAITMFEAV